MDKEGTKTKDLEVVKNKTKINLGDFKWIWNSMIFAFIITFLIFVSCQLLKSQEFFDSIGIKLISENLRGFFMFFKFFYDLHHYGIITNHIMLTIEIFAVTILIVGTVRIVVNILIKKDLEKESDESKSISPSPKSRT